MFYIEVTKFIVQQVSICQHKTGINQKHKWGKMTGPLGHFPEDTWANLDNSKSIYANTSSTGCTEIYNRSMKCLER